MDGPRVYQLCTLGVAAAAATFDWRTGRIPNWLTWGALVGAFPLHAWMTAAAGPEHGPVEGLKWALLGALVCGTPMLIGWRIGWIAGGDVKLVAAMGALSGLSLGLEATFLALLAAASFLVLRLVWDGNLFRTFGDSVTMAAGRAFRRRKPLLRDLTLAKASPVLPPSNLLSSPPAPQSSLTVRFGPFAVVGAALSLVLHGGLA